MPQPTRFQWHRRIVHSALNHLIRYLPIPILPNVPHSASCGLLDGCLKATPSFPTLTVWVGCQQRSVQLQLSVTTQLWLGAGWETVLPALAARAVEWDAHLPNLAGCADPTAALRVGRLAEATERRFLEQTVDDGGRGLGLTPLPGMEWAERRGRRWAGRRARSLSMKIAS